MVIRSTVLASVESVVHGFGGRHDDMAQHFPQYWERRPMQHERHGTARTVSPEPIAQFRQRYAMPARVIASEAGNLNLTGIAAWQLEHAGFATFSAALECTMCHPGDGGFAFHSYRRDRDTRTPIKDVQWSVIAISE